MEESYLSNYKTFAHYLSEMYFENFSEEQAVENFIYLTSEKRDKHTTAKTIHKYYHLKQLGELLRQLDPTAFYQAYTDAKGKERKNA